MEWEIKIEGAPKERLLAVFRPLYGIVEIRGQYKLKNEWVDFSLSEYSISENDLEKLKTAISDALKQLKEQIEKYQDLEKTFKAIGSVSIQQSEGA